MHAEEVIERLGLTPHPEGGFFRETYRADEAIDAGALPDRYDGPRAAGTAIYFLLTADAFSAFHRIASDEVFHWYAGDPARLLQIRPDGGLEPRLLGANLLLGELPQAVVPRGTWQALEVVEGGMWSLLGTTVAPGFDFADFEIADQGGLLDAHPDHAEIIHRLTRT